MNKLNKKINGEQMSVSAFFKNNPSRNNINFSNHS